MPDPGFTKRFASKTRQNLKKNKESANGLAHFCPKRGTVYRIDLFVESAMRKAEGDELALFGQALEFASREEQAAYVAGACGDDAALRARALALLAAHHQAGEFLHGPDSADAVVDALRSEGPGTTIGPFKLLEQIGEGGFGVVFMAEQHQPVRRKVALCRSASGWSCSSAFASPYNTFIKRASSTATSSRTMFW